MNALLVALVAIVNAGQPAQSAMNARLREVLRSPVLAAFASIVVTLVVLGGATASGVMGRGTLSDASRAPWWAWIGGAIGATSVLVNLIALPKISATTMIAAAVFGQLTAAALIDHFAVFGVTRVPLGGARIAGLVLLAAGVLLVQKK